jgi:4-amino-4-deoxy-L-arabinose transferase-like glycosyltransferase
LTLLIRFAILRRLPAWRMDMMADFLALRRPRWLADPDLWIVGLAAGLLCFMHFRAPLQEPQEARYAEIPRQMLAEGSWLTPVLHGQPYYDKPPLFYWLLMASYTVCGVHDWAARLPACGVAWTCILLAYGWGRSALGPRAALLGALMLCLSPRFVQLDRMVTMDGLLCLCVIAAWAAAHRALCAARLHWGWWLLSALACGLGLLTKGPVALVLILPPLLALRWLDPTTARPGLRALAAYLAAALVTAAPWFIALAGRDPDFPHYFFWFHHVQRYVEPFDHEEPFWYYLPELLGGMLPWTLLLPGLAWFLAKRRVGRFGGSLALSGVSSGGVRLRFLIVCSWWCLLFFSLSGCKRAFYILPAMPPLALALGGYLDALVPVGSLWQLRSRPAYWLWLCTWLTGLGAIITASISGLLTAGNGTALAALALLAGGGLLVWHGRQRQATWGLCFITAFLLMLVLMQQLVPSYARRFALRGLVRRHVATELPVFCYPRRWDSIGYYLQRSDVRAFTPEQLPELLAELRKTPEALLFLKTGKPGFSPSTEVLSRLPASLIFEPCGRQGHLTVVRVVRAPVPLSPPAAAK